MGLRLFGRSFCRDNECQRLDCPRTIVETKTIEKRFPVGNPDPKNFVIEKAERIGKYVIVLLSYPDCTNFEGKKILVYRDVTLAKVRKAKSLDPHFCSSKRHISPIARFVPTDEGWELASKFCML